MIKFQLRILGSSSALPTSTRMPSAQVLLYNETPYLIDCAEGTQLQMRKFNVQFGRLKNIFISHLHGDHIYGIFGLLSSFNLLGRKQDLNIFAPEKLKEIYETVLKLNEDILKYKVNFFPLFDNGKNLIYSNKNLNIYSFPLVHSKPTFGFLFSEKQKSLNIRKDVIDKYSLSIQQIVKIKNGEDLTLHNGNVIKNELLTMKGTGLKSYAYCTDTLPLKRLTNYIQNVDLLYHEATFGSELSDLAKQTLHSTAKQAAEIASKINTKKLIIGHFSSRYKDVSNLLQEAKNVFENTIEAKDGLLIDI